MIVLNVYSDLYSRLQKSCSPLMFGPKTAGLFTLVAADHKRIALSKEQYIELSAFCKQISSSNFFPPGKWDKGRNRTQDKLVTFLYFCNIQCADELSGVRCRSACVHVFFFEQVIFKQKPSRIGLFFFLFFIENPGSTGAQMCLIIHHHITHAHNISHSWSPQRNM